MESIRASVVIAILSSVVIGACSPGPDCLKGKPCRNSGSGDEDGTQGGKDEAPVGPTCTEFGRPHIGLGGEDLAAKVDGPINGDRARAKPYSALLTEYTRVLGSKNKPDLIGSTGGTFGVAPDRFYLEPLASAVFVNTAFNVAFEGCLKMTGDVAGGTAEAKYAKAPTAESAASECAAWSRRFWSRDPTPEQIDACVSVALESKTETYGRLDDETTRDTTPKRRWAYACASVLTATGFLMY